MLQSEHFYFQIVAYFIYQIYFQKRFSADKIPYD